MPSVYKPGPGFKHRFTVEAEGRPWDVYSFRKDGKPGTLAISQVDGKWEIGVFCAGTLSEQEVIGKLREDSGDAD
jgi:hypothetical protein